MAVMEQYIRACPFVSQDGAALRAALSGLKQHARTNPARDNSRRGKEQKTLAEQSVNKRRFVPRRMGLVLRTLFLDVPILLVLLGHYALNWMDYMHQEYLHDQLNAMVFTKGRRSKEITYYSRPCDVSDLTTQNGADLFLPKNATSEEAYQHQLKHGFTVFKNVLSEETATNLRNFITARNKDLDDDEAIFVIENDNRYSFGLGTEEPTVTKAMMEIANHPQLRPALEKIMGPNPALIEMTAITSTYGAIDQHYHDDVIPTASAIRYARTFGPSYSIFTVLQNTTTEMGATGACPGTHYCSMGPIDQLCEEEGFQLVGQDGYWETGDSLLMNMNSYHRGSAHTDPDGEDRVMLILTFSPKPHPRAETRQMSEGITFSLRWDMWGHTLDDLAQAETRMAQPWATLRSLGLYKLPGAEWGIDWITGCSMRMANRDYGFKLDELYEYVETGGVRFLPKFLHPTYDEEAGEDYSWYEYLQDAFMNVLDFWRIVLRTGIPLYIGIFVVFGGTTSKDGRRLKSIRNALIRLALFWGIAWYLFDAAKKQADRSDWATDIKAKRRYTHMFKNQEAFGFKKTGLQTFPYRTDVLVENRYGSEYLALYEDFIDGHTGNRFFQELLTSAGPAFLSYPQFLRKAYTDYVVSAVFYNRGRFLDQSAHGAWLWMEDDETHEYVHRQLASHSTSMRRKLAKEIRRLSANYMYGPLRKTALSSGHSVPYLRALETKMFGLDTSVKTEKLLPVPSKAVFLPHSTVAKLPTRQMLPARKGGRPPAFQPQEPEDGAWLVSGEDAEVLSEDFWYVAQILSIDAHGDVQVRYATGEFEITDVIGIRSLNDLEVGDEVEYYEEEDDVYISCEVTEVNEDGTYTVYRKEDETYVEDIAREYVRRMSEEGDGERSEYKAAY